MNWVAEFVVERNGAVCWHEGMRITEGLCEAYQQSTLIQFIVETSASMGVKVGMA